MDLIYDPMTLTDAYKLSHRQQYPEGTTKVYSNFTARGSRVPGVDHVVFFGLQAFLHQFQAAFDLWFEDSEDAVCNQYQRLLDNVLGPDNNVDTDHVRALHRLGYLPLRFKALPEGTPVPVRVPMLTVENTVDEFFWLTNYFETWLSSALWLPCTSATTAHRMRGLLEDWATATGGDAAFVDWQGHDFSMRGMSSIESGAASAAGHLTGFTGSDSLSVFDWIGTYYSGDNGLIAGSVPATEHSVMCAGGQVGERETFDRLLDLYPTGIVSVVADTWDIWSVLTDIVPALKGKVLARDGKLVIRPDSGDPVDILCGTDYRFQKGRTPEGKGVIELLWTTFGGTINAEGYKVLDPHIGAIYGDSITYDRADAICARLANKGFASTNIVFGVGSFSYQYATRDTFQFAMKATHAVVGGVGRDLFKDPVTDNGMKKSATGRLAVLRGQDGDLVLVEKANHDAEKQSELKTVWEDGEFVRTQSFADVRATLRGGA